jgi:hypothetical protein
MYLRARWTKVRREPERIGMQQQQHQQYQQHRSGHHDGMQVRVRVCVGDAVGQLAQREGVCAVAPSRVHADPWSQGVGWHRVLARSSLKAARTQGGGASSSTHGCTVAEVCSYASHRRQGCAMCPRVLVGLPLPCNATCYVFTFLARHRLVCTVVRETTPTHVRCVCAACARVRGQLWRQRVPLSHAAMSVARNVQRIGAPSTAAAACTRRLRCAAFSAAFTLPASQLILFATMRATFTHAFCRRPELATPSPS